MHRLNIFARLLQISANEVVLYIGYRKWKLNHKDKKVIYNLIYSYEKSIAWKYVNLANKQLWDDVIDLVERIWFFIDIEKGNTVNSRAEFRELSNLVSNPMPYIKTISSSQESDLLEKCHNWVHNYTLLESVDIPDADKSGFSDLLKKRKSNRRFHDNKIEKESLFQIIHNWFGIKNMKDKNISHHGSASAGAMYQVDLFVVLFSENSDIKPWKYFYSKKESKLWLIQWVNKSEFIGNSFLPTTLDYSKVNGMFILTGSIEFELEKYWHRTFLYQALEAWSIGQNMVITSLIHGKIKLLQFWWYFEEPLKDELQLDENRYILSSFLF